MKQSPVFIDLCNTGTFILAHCGEREGVGEKVVGRVGISVNSDNWDV